MPSHFSTIGFPIETLEDFDQLAEMTSRTAVEVPVRDGSYLRWTGFGGEEVWLQLSTRRELIGMNPHFSGASRIRVGIEARITRPRGTLLDGALEAWASPSGDSPESGEYPFVFDLPDAAAYPDLEIPGMAEAQVAAFAHQISFFPSEEDYYASQRPHVPGFASRSFIPSGTFRPAGHEVDPPTAEAIFTGQVLQAECRTNPISLKKYWWALVDSLGGAFDVVIDPVLLPQLPAVGGFLSGTFWLSGRLVSYPRARKGWFGKLLDGAV